MLKQYIRFIKKSLYADPHDIVRPYHKIADLAFKIVSLGFAIVGVMYLVATPACYFALTEGGESLSCVLIIDEYQQEKVDLILPTTDHFMAYWLTGFGYMIIAIFISQILVVRLINETLPDHIYLRCFATLEEKKKRLNISD